MTQTGQKEKWTDNRFITHVGQLYRATNLCKQTGKQTVVIRQSRQKNRLCNQYSLHEETNKFSFKTVHIQSQIMLYHHTVKMQVTNTTYKKKSFFNIECPELNTCHRKGRNNSCFSKERNDSGFSNEKK